MVEFFINTFLAILGGFVEAFCYWTIVFAGQESVIRLSLEPGADIPDSEITSSIELCIRTKWPGAAISWNGAEKLL